MSALPSTLSPIEQLSDAFRAEGVTDAADGAAFARDPSKLGRFVVVVFSGQAQPRLAAVNWRLVEDGVVTPGWLAEHLLKEERGVMCRCPLYMDLRSCGAVQLHRRKPDDA